VELLCEAGRKTALSEMGAVSENVGAVSENVGAAPAHVFTACVTKVPNVDPLSSAGMQTVSCDMGAVSCDVGASSCYVSSATATDLDNVKGMRFSGPMHAAGVPNVHDVSALYQEKGTSVHPVLSMDAMDSTGGEVAGLPQQMMGGVRKWKRQARVNNSPGASSASGQSVPKKRKVVSGAIGRRGMDSGKKSKKSEVDVSHTSTPQAEAAQQPRLVL
jgi:hypothetical protein